MSEPIKHHKVPRFLLERFTDQFGKLHVFDMTLPGFRSGSENPKKVCRQRDYYKLDTDEGDPYQLEKVFSNLESEAKLSTDRLVTESKSIVPSDVEVLSSFVALQLSRTDADRRTFGGFQATVAERTLQMMFAHYSKERFNQEFGTVVLGNGGTADSYEKLKDGIEKERYKFETTQAGHIANLGMMYEERFELLQHRDWIIGFAPKDIHFVCSDNPAIVDLDERKGNFRPAGLLMRNSVVLLPLSKSVVAIGTLFEEVREPQLSFSNLPVDAVANINTRIIFRAQTEIYCCEPNFQWLDGDKIVSSSQFVDHLKAKPRNRLSRV